MKIRKGKPEVSLSISLQFFGKQQPLSVTPTGISKLEVLFANGVALKHDEERYTMSRNHKSPINK